MNVAQLTADVSAALGFEDATPLIAGGQKLVLKGTMSGKQAVAKIVPIDEGPNGEITLQRAHREVELLSAVESDRVVKVLTDAVELGDPVTAVCWAEQFLDGDDIRALFNAKWNESDVWVLLRDVAEGLAACHELEVVHRDLSPGNVRRTGDGRFVLMDPGFARHLEKTALTGAYQPGTSGWRSPEHVPGGLPVPASDIFSLGILAYFALSGSYPIDPHVNAQDYDRALLEQQASSISVSVSGLSPELVEIIDRCLNRQPARRFIDGAELVSHLEEMDVDN